MSPTSFNTYIDPGTYSFVGTGINGCGTRTKTQSIACTQGVNCNCPTCPVRLAHPSEDSLISEYPIFSKGEEIAEPEATKQEAIRNTQSQIVYPNPLTSQYLYVNLEGKMNEKAHIEIKDTQQFLIFEKELAAELSEIYVPELKKGMYYCTIHTDTGTIIRELLICVLP